MINMHARDIQVKLPYASCALTVIALIVCATTNHQPLLLVAHSAAAFLNCILCIHHYRNYESEHILPHVHLPYAIMFFLLGIIVGGHGDESVGAVVLAVLALVASWIFYAHEAIKEYKPPVHSSSDVVDMDSPVHQHNIGDLEH